jgi:type III pantothenate kinase
MMLLVDIGNTRVKWTTDAGGRMAPQRAAVYAGWNAGDWQRELFNGPPVERVLAVTVAAVDSRQALIAAAHACGVTSVEFVASTAHRAGVRNSYRQPHLLGADRWVAAIGAYHLAGGACCVADFGTAATIDAVDATGQHVGGFIVPGPALMMASLHVGTSDLAAHTAASAAGAAAAPFADNTRDAIERGCRVALAALVDRACDEMARTCGTVPRLYCTGGAASAVLPVVRTPHEVVPDLVLRGLARIAQSRLEP